MTFQAPQPTTSTEILRREPVIFTFTQSGNPLTTGKILAVDRTAEEQVVATISPGGVLDVTGGYSVVGAVDGSNYTYTCKSHTGWVGDTLDIRIDGEYSSTGYASSATYTLTGDAVTDYVPITDTVSDGLDLLLQQFHESPDFNAWLEAYLGQVAKLSDGVYPTRFSRGIDIATGDRLDWFGQIVNIARGGRTDDDYRLRLRAEMLVLNSGATLDELINILAVLEAFVDPDGLIEVFQHNPHTVVFRYIDFLMTAAEAEARVGILDRADPAAVRSWLIHSYFLDNGIFTLTDEDPSMLTYISDWDYRGASGVPADLTEWGFFTGFTSPLTFGDTDSSSVDQQAALATFTSGDRIRAQRNDDSSWIEYTLTSDSNEFVDYWTVPINITPVAQSPDWAGFPTVGTAMGIYRKEIVVMETSSTLGLGPIYSYGGLYDWDTSGTTSSGLSPGDFRFNNADPAQATQIFVHDTDKGPADRDAFLDALTGCNLQIELNSTSDRGFFCYVVTSTDSGVYHTLDIESPVIVGTNVSGQTNTLKALVTGGALTGVK